MLRTFGAALIAVAAVPTFAAQRLFVASYGSDANPCTLGQPCRGFAAAATLVDPGGEIIVLDSAGYGPVTLTKSVSITSPAGVYAGISVPGGQDGVVINAPSGRVRLEGLSINGTGGNFGVNFLAGTELVIERVKVINMTSGGISATASGAAIGLIDTTIQNNGGSGASVVGATLTVQRCRFEANSATGLTIGDGSTASVTDIVASRNGTHGVLVAANSGSARATIDRGSFVGNGASGAQAGASFTGIAEMDIARSISHLNVLGIAAVAPGNFAFAFATATGNIVSNNTGGLVADGPNESLLATGNTVTRNGVGIYGANQGAAYVGGDNSIWGNATDVGAGVSTYTRQ